MSTIEKIKYKASDFISLATVDALEVACKKINPNWNFDTNDSDGYTPLCSAILNNADTQILLYLTSVKAVSCSSGVELDNCIPEDLRNPKNANPIKVCNKGKSPLQYAILSGNLSAIKFLLSNSITLTAMKKITRSRGGSYFITLVKYENGFPVYIKDKDGNNTDECEYETVDLALDFSGIKVTPSDILSAASLQKPDILKVLSDSYGDIWFYNKVSFDDSCTAFDIYGNTPLIMAVRAQCYDSVELILQEIYKTASDAAKTAITYTNKSINGSTPESAFSIALTNNDKGVQLIFAKYYDDNKLLDYAFTEGIPDLIISLLTGKMFDEDFNILTWSYNSDLLLTKLYNKQNVLIYLDRNYNNSLSDDSPIKFFVMQLCEKFSFYLETEKTKLLQILVQYKCYRIINLLIKNHIITDINNVLYNYAFLLINEAHNNCSGTDLLEIYISSECYYLVELLIKRSLSNELQDYTLNSSEYLLIGSTDDIIINNFLHELAYEES